MSKIAEISVAIKADLQDFSRGTKTAQKQFEEFQRSASGEASKFGDAVTRVNLSAKGAKHIIGELGNAFGASGSALGGTAGAMLKMGPAIGIVVGALDLYNKITEHGKQVTEDMTKAVEQDAEHMERLNEAIGKIPKEGPFGKAFRDEIKSIGKEIDDLAHKFKDSDKWYLGGGAMKEYDAEINAKRNMQMENSRLNLQMRPVNEARTQFDTDTYEMKVATHGKGDDMKNANELKITSEYADRLKQILSDPAIVGENRVEITKQWREEHLKVLDIMARISAEAEKLNSGNTFMKGMRHTVDEFEKSRDAMRVHNEKIADEQNKKIAEQFQESVDASHKVAAELKGMLDPAGKKFVELMDQAADAFNTGLIDNGEMEKLMKKFKKDYEIADNSHGMKMGSALTIDPTHISVANLAASTAIHKNPEEEKRHAELLKKWDELIKITKEKNPVAVVGEG